MPGQVISLWVGAINVWTAAGPVSFSRIGDLPADVTGANWGDYFTLDPLRGKEDGVTPMLYDADGSIIEGMFGQGSKFDILGIAGPDTPLSGTDTTITEGTVLMNGAFFDGLGPASDSPEDVTSIFERPILPPKLEESTNLAPMPVDRIDLKRGYCFIFLKDVPSQAEKELAERFVNDIHGM